MKKINNPSTTNNALKEALRNKNEVISNMLELADDDEKIKRINKFKKLDIWKQDMLYLRTTHTLREIGEFYNVSYIWVRSKLIEIENELKA